MKSFLLLGLLTICSPHLLAGEPPSGEELAEIADIFDLVNEELHKVGYIPEGSELDKALGEVVTVLEELEEVEGNRSLTKSVRALADAWEKLDWEKFKLALDSVIANIDRIRRADCG